jgi:HSP20 family protein
MQKDNRSFFQKLTGAINMNDLPEEAFDQMDEPSSSKLPSRKQISPKTDWEEDSLDGELTVDVYQNGNDIIIKTMVAGVRPEDLDISITRDTVTIKGKRETEKTIQDDDYFHQELYWGTFSRTISLPAEVEVEEAEAIEKHGLLIIRLPKIDKNKQAKLKVRGN